MKTLLCAIFLLCSCHSFAQNTNPARKDTLIWTDGTKYAGMVIKEDKHTGQVQFMTEDSQMHNVSSSSIAQLKRADQLPDSRLPPSDTKPSSNNKQRYTESTEDPTIHWSDPTIPEKIVIKHRTGIGLTIVGTVFIVAGIGLIAAGAAANGQTTTTNTTYSTQTNVNIGATGAVGLVMTIAGLPMMIVGAVKLGKAKRMARSRIINLR